MSELNKKTDGSAPPLPSFKEAFGREDAPGEAPGKKGDAAFSGAAPAGTPSAVPGTPAAAPIASAASATSGGPAAKNGEGRKAPGDADAAGALRIQLPDSAGSAAAQARDEDLRYMSKVDEAWHDRGSRLVRRLLFTMCFLMVAFVVWASLAEIDEVARGQGQVVPSQRVQLVQHLEGGILSDIMVTEGQTVEPGQTLARVDNVTASSVLRDTETRILETRIAIIRLEAELAGEEPVFDEELLKQAPARVEAERSAYLTRRVQWENSQAVTEQQIEQRRQELNELLSRKKNYEEALNLAQKRLDLARPLMQKKLYAETDFLNLQQETVRLRGDIAAVLSSISKTESAVREAEQRRSLSRSDHDAEIVKELNEQRSELASLQASKTAGADRVTRTELKSQVRGVVNRILLNSRGGVVKPGESIMEIVPLDDTLLIETRIRPSDIAFIHPEQKAVVKLTAYDAAIYGSLDALVEQIGADTITTPQGEVFFLVKVRTKENAIHHGKETLPIMPGMVATVDILTGKKTVLQYLMKPITRAQQYALSER